MQLANNQLLAAKVENTYGSDSTPVSATDSIKCSRTAPAIDVAKLLKQEVRRSVTPAKEIMGKKMLNFTIMSNLKGSGTVDTPPEISPLLQACALKETINSGVSVVYTPISTPASLKSCTIYFWLDGELWKAVGCMGNFAIMCPAGGNFATIQFNMRGKFLSKSAVALPSDQVFDSTDPVVVGSGGMSFGAFNTAIIKDLSLNSQNTIIDRASINAADGVLGAWFTARNPSWNSKVEAELAATKDWFGNWTAGTEEAIDLTLGSSGGNIVEISIPQAYISNPPVPQYEDEMAVLPLSGRAIDSAGDDNFSLTFK